ncbi:peptidyl-prolyl cis-trans isomerase NIMA-interacting 1 [Helicoverpa armigera]|uniref:peptidyl-prolyl cis-trans isomerase NIMA-interacting 1 n=1 Tax=Helicoverpa armigera TaxID=29058 RepID=UPI002112E77C|nr:peptidyl-prolyl cis-trans isomerase NIMA-interacting 1 [Helicoverpa armigera]
MSSGRRLPRGWRSMISRTTGGVFYFNRYTQTMQWHRPGDRPTNGHTSHSAQRERSRSRSPQQRLACSHILIKHKDCRNPIDSNDKPVTRTKEEAKLLAAEIHERITRDLITFADAAVGFSECASARNQGDIQPSLQRGRMQQSFEEAALALEVGQVSGIVESSSGFHIIMRRE